jgi:hypothetical protein
MSGEGLGKPKNWKARAEECRATAQRLQDDIGAATLLKIAEMYDDLAARAAEQEARIGERSQPVAG